MGHREKHRTRHAGRPVETRVRHIEAGLRKLLGALEDPFAEHTHQRYGDEADRRARGRLKHEPDDHAGKNGEVLPRMLSKAFGSGNDRNHDHDHDHKRCNAFPESSHGCSPWQQLPMCYCL